ncbi:MAG TPA: L-lactate permease, partial [Calditerricola sp.]
MVWNQVYMPVGGSLWLSALVALIPIVFFFYALAVRRMPGHKAGLITVALAVLIAVVVYRMPVSMALTATGYGIAYGLWPIAWIIVTAVFLYKITVKSGQFAVIRASVVTITEDQRLQ